MRAIDRHNWRSMTARLLFELVVVFIGVYSAFALAEYQAQRERQERRQQIQHALVRDIEDIVRNTRGAADQFGQMISFYDSAFAAQATPIPVPWLEPVRVRSHMWDAAVGSGSLELLDVATIYSLSDFFNDLNLGFLRLEQYRELSESTLLPNLDSGASEFYERPGQLRGKYSWYMPTLRRLKELADRISNKGDTLIRILSGVEIDSLSVTNQQ